MWKKITDTEFYINCEVIESNSSLYGIYITDFVTIWSKLMQKSMFIQLVKESNIHLEMDDMEFMDKAVETLRNPEKLNIVETNFRENEIELKITKLLGFPLRINFTVTEGSKELFYKKVTLPLLKEVIDLRQSQQELCQLLDKKDTEIKEYKEEGGRIARFLKTPYFDEKKHLEKHNCHTSNFGFAEVPQQLIDKAESIGIKQEKEVSPPKEVVFVEAKKEEQHVSTVKTEAPLTSQAPVRKKPKKVLNL